MFSGTVPPGLLIGLAGLHAYTWIVLLTNLVYLRRSVDRTPASWPTLSVCIPARNEADNLRRLLPSLLSQHYPSVEVHVWDDASEDDTWAVLQDHECERLKPHRGSGPPDGWVGKVYALHQCTRRANGDYYLFLDADTELSDRHALRRLLSRHFSVAADVTSTLPRLRGAASVLVSLIPYTMLSLLPWPLVRRTQWARLSALNGQCWLINASLYHAHEPHASVHDRILEDVAIGRFLKQNGHPPALIDAQDAVSVFMYTSFAEAWQGFRKNAYLLLGGHPLSFGILWMGFLLKWIVAPLLSPWLLASLYGLKLCSDRSSRFPSLVSLLAPVSFVLGTILQLDSALHHWFDRVYWKGRAMPTSRSQDP